MNKTTAIIAAAGMILLAACKEKKTTEDIITTRQEMPKLQAPISMQEYRQNTQVEWKGQTYHVDIRRVPVDSLPMVEDEIGQKYVDNRIYLTVMRADSTVFYNKTFTKNTFASYLDDEFRRNGILEAMVFEKMDDNRLKFAVSVAYPQSEDEFILLTMKLDADGGLTIKRDETIDTSGQDEEEDDKDRD
jgi:hypothetical protein